MSGFSDKQGLLQLTVSIHEQFIICWQGRPRRQHIAISLVERIDVPQLRSSLIRSYTGSELWVGAF